MTTSALIIDVPGVLLVEDAVATGAAALFARMQLAGVPIILCAPAAAPLRARLAPVLTTAMTAITRIVESETFPRPGDLLRLLRDLDSDPFTSWLLCAREPAVRAAETLGCAGVVWFAADDPAWRPRCPFARTDHLADAPRVMIPPAGGCWHDRRT